MIREHALGFWYRDDTNDATGVLRDVGAYDALPIAKGCTVLDLGGHIGLFALRAYSRGAAQVVSVEPESENAAIHRFNTAEHRPHILLEAACTAELCRTTTLYVNLGRNKAFHSTLSLSEDRLPVEVPAVQFDKLVQCVEPTVLKVDVEGEEHHYSWSLPPCVRAVAVELHFNVHNDASATRVQRKLISQSFKLMSVAQGDGPYRLEVYSRG